MTFDLSKYSHIIWDWNGTLFDDAALCHAIMAEVFRDLELPAPSPELQQELFRHPIQDYYAALGVDFNIHPFEKIAEHFFLEYNKRMKACLPRRFAADVLAEIKKQGKSQYILSAVRQDVLEELVKAVGFLDYFESLIGLSDHFGRSKLENGKTLLASLATSPQEVLLIGDTLHDVEVGHALGVTVALIYSGYQAEEILRTTQTATVLPCLSALVQLKI